MNYYRKQEGIYLKPDLGSLVSDFTSPASRFLSFLFGRTPGAVSSPHIVLDISQVIARESYHTELPPACLGFPRPRGGQSAELVISISQELLVVGSIVHE